MSCVEWLAKQDTDWTALHNAVWQNRTGSVEILILAGADPAIKTNATQSDLFNNIFTVDETQLTALELYVSRYGRCGSTIQKLLERELGFINVENIVDVPTQRNLIRGC